MRLVDHEGYRSEPVDTTPPVQRILGRVELSRQTGADRWMCRCPAHADRNPSMSLRELEDGVALVHCFAGCTPDEILASLELTYRDLWPHDAPGRTGNGLSRRERGKLEHCRTILAIMASDRDRGVDQTPEDKAAEEQARKTLERAGEPAEEEPLTLPIPPTVTAFLALQFEPLQPIMGPFTTHQLVMLHATAGAGKTMFTLNLGWHISEGLSFLGWTCAGPQRVLIIDGEMSAHMQQERLKCGGSDRLRIANLAGWGAEMEPLNLATEAGQTLVRYWLEATQTRVLVLDNLMSLAWVDGTSVNSDEYWTPVRRFAVQLRAAGYLVIIVDHSNTSSGEIFGTKTKLWHADLVLRLTSIEVDEGPEWDCPKTVGQRPKFKVSWDKVRGGTNPPEMTVKLGGVGHDLVWELSADSDRREARQMRENGKSIRDIADILGVSKSRVGRWVK